MGEFKLRLFERQKRSKLYSIQPNKESVAVKLRSKAKGSRVYLYRIFFSFFRTSRHADLTLNRGIGVSLESPTNAAAINII